MKELNPDQQADQKKRVTEANTLFSTKMKDIIQEVEQTYQIRFLLGLDYGNFAISPVFVPRDLKDYNAPTE